MRRFWMRSAMEAVDKVELSPSELTPVFKTLLDERRASVAHALDELRGQEVSLAASIDHATERLRQVRVAIAAFGEADSILAGGQQAIALPVAAECLQLPQIVRGVSREIAADQVISNGIALPRASA